MHDEEYHRPRCMQVARAMAQGERTMIASYEWIHGAFNLWHCARNVRPTCVRRACFVDDGYLHLDRTVLWQIVLKWCFPYLQKICLNDQREINYVRKFARFVQDYMLRTKATPLKKGVKN